MEEEKLESTEEIIEIPEETEEESETTQQEEIPDELAGLPEDIAREAMNEAFGKPAEKSDEEQEDGEKQDEPVNKNIHYPRFKEKIDETNELKKQLAAYRERYGELNAPKQNAAPEPTQRQAMPPQPVPMQITPEISKRIDEIVNDRALQMTGMKKEDLKSLEEYGEDDNEQLKTYKNAREIARAAVMSEISEAMRFQRAKQQEAFENQQRVIADYNQFYQNEMSEPDFKETQNYAVNGYFTKLSPAEQFAVRESYQRIEQNAATPQDVMIIKRYFSDAKTAYRSENNVAPKPVERNVKPKIKPAMPKAWDVEGSAASPAKGITVESLAKMLDENDIDKIPLKYQKMLQG